MQTSNTAPDPHDDADKRLSHRLFTCDENGPAYQDSLPSHVISGEEGLNEHDSHGDTALSSKAGYFESSTPPNEEREALSEDQHTAKTSINDDPEDKEPMIEKQPTCDEKGPAPQDNLHPEAISGEEGLNDHDSHGDSALSSETRHSESSTRASSSNAGYFESSTTPNHEEREALSEDQHIDVVSINDDLEDTEPTIEKQSAQNTEIQKARTKRIRSSHQAAIAAEVAAGMTMPAAVNEVTFPILDPPLTPVTPSSITPVVYALNDLTSNDVLLGRGGGTNGQIGNYRFRKLIHSFQPLYLICRRNEKVLLARSLVLIVRKRGGRFLRRNEDAAEAYCEVGDDKAVAKTGQALREGLDVRGHYTFTQNVKNARRKMKNLRPADDIYDSPINQFFGQNAAFASDSIMHNQVGVGITYNSHENLYARTAPTRSFLTQQVNIVNRNDSNPAYDYNYQGNNSSYERSQGIAPDAMMRYRIDHGNAQPLSTQVMRADFAQSQMQGNPQPLSSLLIHNDFDFPQSQMRGNALPMERQVLHGSVNFPPAHMRGNVQPIASQVIYGNVDFPQAHMRGNVQPTANQVIRQVIHGNVDFPQAQMRGNGQPIVSQVIHGNVDFPHAQMRGHVNHIASQVIHGNVDFPQAQMRGRVNDIRIQVMRDNADFLQTQIRGNVQPMQSQLMHGNLGFPQAQMRGILQPMTGDIMRENLDFPQAQMRGDTEPMQSQVIYGDFHVHQGQMRGQPMTVQRLRGDFDVPTPQTRLFVTQTLPNNFDNNQMMKHQMRQNYGNSFDERANYNAAPYMVSSGESIEYGSINDPSHNQRRQNSSHHQQQFIESFGDVSSGNLHSNPSNHTFVQNSGQGQSVYQSFHEINPLFQNRPVPGNGAQPNQYLANSSRGRPSVGEFLRNVQ